MELEDIFYDDKDDYIFKDDAFFEKMDEDLDFAFALSLQTEYNEETEANFRNSSTSTLVKGKPQSNAKPLSIVDEQWELIDPHPDIHCLFLDYNTKFFYGKLQGVEVKWSPRMKLCAGVCSYEGRGGLCSVRLSGPLLKLRPRRDLVETLLHEMIHAYLFVTHNNKDHDAHGPEFLKHMYRINNETGTRITVYHSFHDEVDLYRTHWWKCDGPCKHRRPFYGLVKRSMNRAPGPKDTWWAQHQSTCGGSFIKIREPDNFGCKKATKRKPNSDDSTKDSDIRSFLSSGSSNTTSVLSENFSNTKGKKIKSANVPRNIISGNKTESMKEISTFSNVNRVKTIFEKDDNSIDINKRSKTAVASIPTSSKKILVAPFSGTGFTLGSSSSSSSKPQSNLLDRFSSVKKSSSIQNVTSKENEISVNIDPKKSGKTHSGNKLGNEKVPKSAFNLSSDSPKSSNVKSKKLIQSPIKNFFPSSPNRARNSKKIIKSETTAHSSSLSCNTEKSCVNCPVCFTLVKRDEINSHLDRCLSDCA